MKNIDKTNKQDGGWIKKCI